MSRQVGERLKKIEIELGSAYSRWDALETLRGE